MLKIQSTNNVPMEIIKDLASELSLNFDVEAEDGQFFYKSADPPTWITFLAEADWWIKILAAGAAYYVIALINESAKSTWMMVSKKITSKFSKDNPIQIFSTKTAAIVQKLSPNLRLFLSLPIPDEYNSTKLELTLTGNDEIAMQLALFTHHLPGLMELIRSEVSSDDRILGGFQLVLQENGSLEVVWKTISFSLQKRVLSLYESSV